ncbi:hypothetical protein GE061_006009 [Apolygus lucorum]|uniref:Uncharacterized protein n=1 Tax=Apolygus lucorum TaxID=248454 RepID=A0A6A4J9E4_APOLU|nr:hypothetical protein GE061_006009 [Apolygus lucorum]
MALVPKSFTPRNLRERMGMLLKQFNSHTMSEVRKKSANSEEYALRSQLLQDVHNLKILSKSKSSSQLTTQYEGGSNNPDTSSNSGANPTDVQTGPAEYIIEDENSNISAINEAEVATNNMLLAEEVVVALRETPNSSHGSLLDTLMNSSTASTARRSAAPHRVTIAPVHDHMYSNQTLPCTPVPLFNSTTLPDGTTAAEPETDPLKSDSERRLSSSSDSSSSTDAADPSKVKKDRARENQLLEKKHEIELIKAKAELLKQENEKKRLELEEKTLDSMQNSQSRLISIVEQLLKQRSRPEVKDQSLNNHSSTFVLHPTLP